MKTVVGAFDRILEAEDAIARLEAAGIDRNAISLVAQDARGGTSASGTQQDKAAGVGAGAALGGAAGLLLGFAALAVPGVGPLIAAGPIAAAFAAGGVGAAVGGVAGALTGVNVPESDANYYAEQVRRGGALLIVTAADDAAAQRAREVMDRTGGVLSDELQASSRPDVPQLTQSGARLYDVDGLEFDPTTSRLEDFGKK